MPSDWIDELNKLSEEEDWIDQLDKEQGDWIDQLNAEPEVPIPGIVPFEPTKVPKVKTTAPMPHMFRGPAEAAFKGVFGPGISGELEEGKAAEIITDTISGLSDFVTKPMETYRGIADFALAIPGFLVGVLSGASRAAKELIDQMLLGRPLEPGKPGAINLSKVYDAASEGMQESMEFFEPGKELLMGKKVTEESQRVAEVAMVPLTGLSMVGHKVAAWEGFEGYPNIQGAAKFMGDIAGFAAMGMLVHGKGRRAEVAREMEAIVIEADKIATAEKAIEGIPNEVVKQLQQKILDGKKRQLELKADAAANKISEDVAIREELLRQEERVALEKTFPVAKTGLKKPKVKKAKPEVRPEEALEEVRIEAPKLEPITETDQKTGTPVPGLEGERSPFFQDSETTEVYKKLFEDRAKSVAEEPEVFTQKLINDVNRWYKGDNSIDIARTRQSLSDLVALEDSELRGLFLTGKDYLDWKETASEAATWARRLKRPELPEGVTAPKDVIDRLEIERTEYIKRNPNKYYHDPDTRVKDVGVTKEAILAERGSDPEIWFAKGPNVEEIQLPKNPKIMRIPEKKAFAGPEWEDILPSIEKAWKEGYDVIEEGRMGNIYINPKLKRTRVTDILEREVSERGREIDYFGEGEEGPKLYTGIPVDQITDIVRTKVNYIKGFIERYYHYDKETIERELTDFNKDINDLSGSERLGLINKLYKFGKTIDKLRSKPQKEPLFEFKAIPLKDFVKDIDPSVLKEKKYRRGLKIVDKPEGDLKLYTGIPIDKVIDSIKKLIPKTKPTKPINISKFPKDQQEIVQRAVNYKTAFTRDMHASEKVRKLTFGKAKWNTAESLYDTKSYARKMLLEGQKNKTLTPEANYALQKMVNEAGGHGYAHVMFDQFYKEIFGGLNKDSTRILNQLIRGKRIQDIANYKIDTKFPKDQSWEDATAYEFLFEGIEQLSPSKAKDFLRRRDAYFEWMNRLVDIRLEEGIIDKETADGLKSHDYAKFRGIGQRLEDGKGGEIEALYDEKYTARVGGRAVSVTSSGIDSLAKGRRTDILETDQALVALEVFNRTYGRAFTNRTFRDLADMARKNPDNPYVRLGKKEAAEGQPGMADSRGWVKHFFWEDGKKKIVYIEPNFAVGLGVAGRDLSPRAITMAKLTTLSTIAKMTHTGIAPFWSTFVNLPLDVHHALLTAGTYRAGKFKPLYSQVWPVGYLQMGRDFKQTFYDTFFRAYKQPERIKFMRAAERGILMPFLASQGRLSRKGYKLPGKLSKLEDFLTYYPNSLELWTRISIMERKIRQAAVEEGISKEGARANNRIMDEAVFAGRDYLDFNQGGWFVKMKDQLGWIYLNAFAQVLRTEARSAKEAPGPYFSKVAQTIAVPTILATSAAMLYAPRTKKSVPTYVDESNFTLPFPDSFIFKDAEGQEFGLVLSVPLGTGPAFFKNLMQGLTEKFMYESGLTTEEPNYKAIVGSLTKMAPDLMSLPPAQRALVEYSLNLNFWTRRQQVPHSFEWPKSAEEYVKGETPEIGIGVGEVTKLSPERLDLVRRDILGNNIWTYAIGEGFDKAFGDVPKEMREEHLALTLAEIPGINRFIKVVRIGGERFEKQREIIDEERFTRFIDSRNVDFYSKLAYWYGSTEGNKELWKYLAKPDIVSDPLARERLLNRSQFIMRIKNLPERDTWVNLWYDSAAVKAKDFEDRLTQATTPEARKRLWEQFAIVFNAKGYIGDEFRRELEKLRSQPK